MSSTWDCEQPAFSGQTGWRHVVAFLVFIIILICYADRTNIGLVFAQSHFDSTIEGHKGLVFSSFYVGYLCTQIPGGYLARRWGAKPTFILAATIWTLFDVLTPFAARLGLVPLIAVRVGMGLGEGMTFPSQYGMTSFWVPSQERSFLVNCMTSGQDIGSTLATTLSPRLAEHGAWLVFVCWGSFAAIWCLAFVAFGASAPEVHRGSVRSGEARWIAASRKAQAFQEARLVREPLVPARLVREPCIWAIFAGHLGASYLGQLSMSWMPVFWKGRFALNLATSSEYLAAPYLCAWLGNVCSGKLADVLILWGVRTRHVRKGMQAAGCLGMAVFFQLVAWASSPGWAVVWASCALFFLKATGAGFWVNMVDVCPESAASVMGMSNTLAAIAGIVAQPLTQAILDSAGGPHSASGWSFVFGVGGSVALTSAAIFAGFADDRNLDAAAGDGNDLLNSHLVASPCAVRPCSE